MGRRWFHGQSGSPYVPLRGRRVALSHVGGALESKGNDRSSTESNKRKTASGPLRLGSEPTERWRAHASFGLDKLPSRKAPSVRERGDAGRSRALLRAVASKSGGHKRPVYRRGPSSMTRERGPDGVLHGDSTGRDAPVAPGWLHTHATWA